MKVAARQMPSMKTQTCSALKTGFQLSSHGYDDAHDKGHDGAHS